MADETIFAPVDRTTTAPVPAPMDATQEVQLAPTVVVEATKSNTCKTCKNKLDIYDGANPAKAGTGFCSVCGTRQLLKG